MKRDTLRGWFELSRGGSQSNMRPMEGLRGFAVLLVFLVHFVTLAEGRVEGGSTLQMVAGALRTLGNTGVDLFFVLSGCLIYGSLLARKQAFAAYMARRLRRIYPAFLVVFALYVAISVAVPTLSRIPPGHEAATLYLVQNLLLLPGLFPIEPMITVAWSLSYELFFYLAVPVLIGLLRLRDRSRAFRCTVLLALVAAVVAWCAAAGGGPIRLVMFLMGMLLVEVLAGTQPTRHLPWLGGLALLAGLSSKLIDIELPGLGAVRVAFLGWMFLVVCWACFAKSKSAIGRFFSLTPLRWLGNMSYSYYLAHSLALKAVFIVLDKWQAGVSWSATVWLGWMVFAFIASMVPSLMLYLGVERPLSLAASKG